MRRMTKLFTCALALSLIAAACGGGDDETAEPTGTEETTTTAGGDVFGDGGDAEDDDDTDDEGEGPCADVTPEATEIGVTADTITLQVSADVGSPLAPGLFQGSIDAIEAWAEHVNEEGGIACREIVIEEFDSALSPQETVNGILRACENSFAQVGSSQLFVNDLSDMSSCPDMAGEPTGLPDISATQADAAHVCNPTTFFALSASGACPYSGQGPRDYARTSGPTQYLIDEFGPLHGISLLPGDFQASIAVAMPVVQMMADQGIEIDGVYAVSGAADQSTYTTYVQQMKSAESNFAQTVSNDQSMLKLRREANIQGVDADVWLCTIACYTSDFIAGEAEATEGTYIVSYFLPFSETDTNEELATFIDAMGDPQPQSWAANSWATGLMFEQAVDAIVESDGPNGLTRAALLDALANLGEFDANGMFAPVNPGEKNVSDCWILLQVEGGEFTRVRPEEEGEFSCDDELLTLEGFDAIAEFDRIGG